MAKLPYTITICPDEPNPKQFTAMTPALVNAMRFADDLTINQNQLIWPASKAGATEINSHKNKATGENNDTKRNQQSEERTQPAARGRSGSVRKSDGVA